ANTIDNYWKSEFVYWTFEVDQFLTLRGIIKKAAESIVSPDDTDEQKARKLYAAVMKLDNTDFSRQKSEAERKKDKLQRVTGADDVWKNQAGTGDEIALLYVALARAAGLKAWPMWIVNRDRAVFNNAYLDPSQFDDYIAIVDFGGKEIYLDPGQKVCPFGVLQWAHTLTGGIRESPTGSQIARTPCLNLQAKRGKLRCRPDHLCRRKYARIGARPAEWFRCPPLEAAIP
ncbi:MAG: transglutaminase domain-containing protein, partial [Terracidiphilus sp.]